jgi:hypothetical protein
MNFACDCGATSFYPDGEPLFRIRFQWQKMLRLLQALEIDLAHAVSGETASILEYAVPR